MSSHSKRQRVQNTSDLPAPKRSPWQVHRCLVTRVDSNAVMLSGYNRGAHLTDNEFVWIGDSVIASWGYTAPLGGKTGDGILAQYKSGVDGTNGEQPRGTTATGNFIHELGHYEKQSSPWFQAKSAQNNFSGNSMYRYAYAHTHVTHKYSHA